MVPANPQPGPRVILLVPAILAALLFLLAVSSSDLSRREGREAIPVVHMLLGDSLLLPRANDQSLRTKPPAYHWAAALVSSVYGEATAITVRLPSALAGMATVLAITLFGGRLFSPATGLLAGVVLATSWRTVYLATHARVDMVFAFFVTMSFIALWPLVENRQGGRERGLKAGGWMGLALLAKGPLGMAFPLGALAFYSRYARPRGVPWLWLLLLPVAVFSAWFAFALAEGGPEFRAMVYNEYIGRALGRTPSALHPNPFYYYVPQLLTGFAPWSLFLPWALWRGLGKTTRRPEAVYLASAVGFIFFFLSVFSGKRGDYLLPLYPMAALLVAWALTREGREESAGFTWPGWLLAALALLLAAAALIFAGWPEQFPATVFGFMKERDAWIGRLLLEKHLPGTAVLVIAGGVFLALAAALAQGARTASRPRLSVATALFSALVLVLVHGPGARMVNAHSSYKAFAEQAAARVGQKPVHFFGLPAEDLFFYFNRPDNPVREGSMDDAIQAFLKDRQSYLLVRKPEADWMMAHHAGLAVVLENPEAFEPFHLIRHAP